MCAKLTFAGSFTTTPTKKYVTINVEWKKGKNKWLQFLPHNFKNKLVLLNQIFKKRHVSGKFKFRSSSDRKTYSFSRYNKIFERIEKLKMSINSIFLTIISQTSSGRSTKISKKKSIRNLKLLCWKSLLVLTDPVDRLVKYHSRKKSVGISNNIRVQNAVNMMETLNSSLRHYFLIQTKRVKLRRIKLNVTCPSI